MDIRTEFTQYCGPSVLFVDESHPNRTLKITYTIPAIDHEPRFVIAHLRNGLEVVLRQAVRRCAQQAQMDAYRRTGHRDADMKQLLQGKLVHG